jgi:hypothetical protein
MGVPSPVATPETGSEPAARTVAASQARLNEIIAEIAIASADPDLADLAVDRHLIGRVLDALRDLNLAGGYPFFHESSGLCREEHQELLERMAAVSVRRVETYLKGQAIRARAPGAHARVHGGTEGDNLRQRGGGAGPALIYLVTHDGYGAAKVGIGDMRGLRLAQHRREGWQVCATFQVTAKAAIAIEADILRWWRRELGRPSYLGRHQMPQGGHTETVALAGIDLAATVTRICSLAVRQDARPAGKARAGAA